MAIHVKSQQNYTIKHLRSLLLKYQTIKKGTIHSSASKAAATSPSQIMLNSRAHTNRPNHKSYSQTPNNNPRNPHHITPLNLQPRSLHNILPLQPPPPLPLRLLQRPPPRLRSRPLPKQPKLLPILPPPTRRLLRRRHVPGQVRVEGSKSWLHPVRSPRRRSTFGLVGSGDG